MTAKPDEHLDHGDRPITFAEIVASLKEHPLSVRFRGERRRHRLRPDFEPPDFEPPPLHDRIGEWSQ